MASDHLQILSYENNLNEIEHLCDHEQKFHLIQNLDHDLLFFLLLLSLQQALMMIISF